VVDYIKKDRQNHRQQTPTNHVPHTQNHHPTPSSSSYTPTNHHATPTANKTVTTYANKPRAESYHLNHPSLTQPSKHLIQSPSTLTQPSTHLRPSRQPRREEKVQIVQPPSGKIKTKHGKHSNEIEHDNAQHIVRIHE
jgi:hypothetical protein